MHRLILLYFLLVGAIGFGQSKKAINQQLITELSSVLQSHDSIELVHKANQRDIRILRDDLSSLGLSIMQKKREENAIRFEIKRNHAILSEMDFDANTIVSLSNVDSLQFAPIQNRDYTDNPEWFNKSFQLNKAPVIEDMTEMKLKAQNEMLKLKIAQFVATNNRNKTLLTEEQQFIADFAKTKEEFIAVLKSYKVFNNGLQEKSNALETKYIEVNRKKIEEERLKAEKMAASKAKNSKSSKTKFVPPVIIDREVDYNDLPWNDMNVSSDYPDEKEPFPVVEKKPSQEPEIYDLVEEQAMFPGGYEKLKTYLKDSLRLPNSVRENGIVGKVYMKFVVSTTGNISNVKLLKGITDCKECDEEAVRIVKAMPDWTPAKNNGKTVNSYYTIPIKFSSN